MEQIEKCREVINLATPRRSERRRGFQPPWYTVWVYVCPKCGRERFIRANSFLGKRAVPSVGGIYCDGPIPGFASTYLGERAS